MGPPPGGPSSSPELPVKAKGGGGGAASPLPVMESQSDRGFTGPALTAN